MIRSLLFVLVSTALAVTACTPLKPSGGRPKPETPDDPESGQLTLTIDPQKILSLREGETVERLRVRIHAVVDGTRGDQEGDDQLFPIAADGLYTVRGVRVGWKELVLTLLNARGEAVGEGFVRHLVGFGAQTLPEVTIQEVPPVRRRRDMAFWIFPRFDIPGSEPKTTYLDVKGALVDHKCVTCHRPDYEPDGSGGTQGAGGLSVTSFPFESLSFPTQPEIVTDMITWMTFSDPTYRMPPPPTPAAPAAVIDVFRKWVADGTLANPPGSDQTDALSAKLVVQWALEGGGESGRLEIPRGADATRPFAATLAGCVIGGRYDLAVDVVAADGRVVHSHTFTAQLVGESGDLDLTVDVPYAEPVLDVPVVVTPAP